MTKSNEVPAIGKVEMVFNQVDDHAEITVNGHTFSQGLLHHGHGPVTKDITPYLKEGKNSISIEVTNGPAWATFIASLKDDGAIIHQWHNVNAGAPKNQVFLYEGINRFYKDGHAKIGLGQNFWLEVRQVDDHLTIDINNGQKIIKHGLTHHGQAGAAYNLTPHMEQGPNTVKLTLFNGPAHAVFIGALYTSSSPQDSKARVHAWEFHEAAGEKNDIVFEEELELILEG